jgi:dethiobiotin synthetase
MTPFIVTATDTDVGKTVVAAMLTLALDGIYWKPIQCGTENGTDTERVRAMTGLGPERFRPERYCLRAPLSPHRAAELEGVTIDPDAQDLPNDVPQDRPLIIEGAGGVLVPVTRRLLQIDLFARWRAPAVVCARTALGTINHTLLTLEALRRRAIPLVGIVFVGDEAWDSEQTIAGLAGVKRLGRLPRLAQLDAPSLREAFETHFDRGDFDAAR